MAKDLGKALQFAPRLNAIIEMQLAVFTAPPASSSEKTAKAQVAELVNKLTEDERRMLAVFGKSMIALAGYL